MAVNLTVPESLERDGSLGMVICDHLDYIHQGVKTWLPWVDKMLDYT